MLQGHRVIWEDVAKADKSQAYTWVHCASLGEFEQGRPIIERIKSQNPDTKILLTFFSPSGYEVRKNYEGADLVIYLPFDSPRNAARLLRELTIKKAIFIKYEFWFFYLRALQKRHIPTYVASAIFRENQVFFKWYGGFFRRMLKRFTMLFVQNQASKSFLEEHGFENVMVAGDTRFDRVADIVKEATDITSLETFKDGKTVVVAGSTWPKDEELLINFINKDDGATKYIIAPHEVHESHVEAICKALSVDYVRYTQLDESKLSTAKVLVIDTIGILSSAYRYGEVAYIGGGFGVGIHNTLEAATYGMPVIFGPNYQKFKEAVDLVNRIAGFSITNQAELNQQLSSFLEDSSVLQLSSKAAASYVKENVGATDAILAVLK